MAKRKLNGFEQNTAQKKIKAERTNKRNATDNTNLIVKRRKVYEYWHLAPLTREERAAQMACIYQRIICK